MIMHASVRLSIFKNLLHLIFLIQKLSLSLALWLSLLTFAYVLSVIGVYYDDVLHIFFDNNFRIVMGMSIIIMLLDRNNDVQLLLRVFVFLLVFKTMSINCK